MGATAMGPMDGNLVLPDAPELEQRRLRVSDPLPPIEQLPPESDTVTWVSNRKKELGTE